jgi:uncharacterized protein YdaU (DUF1376 family)
MHYYQFNIADWNLSTAHLSVEEEAVYFRLVNFYYDTETPISLDNPSVLRRLRLANHSETVGLILAEYFVETDKGWEHTRCSNEIKKYRKYTQRQRSNGAKGGRPRTQRATEKPSGNPTVSQNEPKITLTTNHKPLTTNQEPLTIKQGEGRTAAAAIPFTQIIDLYHKHLPTLPQVLKLTEKRKGQIRQRHTEDVHSLDRWESFFAAVSRSDFLMGRKPAGNGRDTPFRADLEWLTNSTNFTRFAEGKYHD